MPSFVSGRTRAAATCALAVGAALLGGCKPGGDYGYNRVSHREEASVPQAAYPDAPPIPAGGLAGAAVARIAARNLPAGVTQAMVDQGQDLFGAKPCAGCHGPGGAGTPACPSLNDARWINITGAYPEIEHIITTGVPAPKEHPGPMPPKGGAADLTADQVKALAAYVYALSHTGAS